MQAEFAFLADAAEAAPNGKLYVLGGGISEVFAPSFPWMHPVVTLVVNLRLHASECERLHKLDIQFWDADGNVLPPQLSAEFNAPRHRQHPARDVFLQLVFNIVGLQLPQPGEYDFHVVVDGQHLKTLPLYAQQGQPGLHSPPIPGQDF